MRIILAISSDIGTALAEDWLKRGEKVVGTYRTWSENCTRLEAQGAVLIKMDFTHPKSIVKGSDKILAMGKWSVLVLAAGDQRPIGLFVDVNFDEWIKSIDSNLMGMLRFLHLALNQTPYVKERAVIMFAGGATNTATERYSAYTTAKIASIKLCELLDFESQNTKFTILGPGWVKTKIHDATLEAPISSGNNYSRTINMLESEQLNPVDRVVRCCNWAISQPKSVVGGRNFSVVHDAWPSKQLEKALQTDPNLYKLRRDGNTLTFEKDASQ